jgi:hypothetical protein
MVTSSDFGEILETSTQRETSRYSKHVGKQLFKLYS